ncbi:MAG: hypothetical protein JWO00_503 [Candidatus Parcubacteria bacterium]|nr:hypothetical protein [Candidatus Parcubacteria bacterium]
MNSKTTPKDFFLHLGATIVLYVGAGALISLAFSIINYLLPDQLAGYFYAPSLAWPISMLLVLTPLLYILEWVINRDVARIPEKRDIWIRRWRMYLTIFLTVALIGGDLIALINVYLNGEVTARFIYKILAILIIAGTIGKYYFFSIVDSPRWTPNARRFIPWFGIVLVLAAVIGGFLVVGSPAKQRNMRFDNQRVSDLTNIQWQLVNQWQQKGTLPTTLSALNDSISGFTVPTDPATSAQYEYVLKDKTSFDLCATFALESQDTKGRGAYSSGGFGGTDMSYPSPAGVGVTDDSWAHPAGHACFTRTIDPSRYPVSPKQPPLPASAAY